MTVKQAEFWDARGGNLRFRNRPAKKVTFKGKLERPIHRWFRLTPSFSPDLVEDIFDYLDPEKEGLVLDPFCGVGTTPLVVKSRNFGAAGIEINPVLYFVSYVKNRRYPRKTVTALPDVIKKFEEEILKVKEEERCFTDDAFFLKWVELVPKISNIRRWWEPHILRDLLVVKIALNRFNAPRYYKNLIRLAVISILIAVSKAKHNHPSLSFGAGEEVGKNFSVFNCVVRKLNIFYEDLSAESYVSSPNAEIVNGDAREVNKYFELGDISAVITSPPYPNRFSYTRETRPHLYFFDFLKTPGDAGKLDANSIGGTWGSATSALDTDKFEFSNPKLEKLLGSAVADINNKNRILGNYVIKYWNDMEEHVASLTAILHKGVPAAYVLGNSFFYDVHLVSDEILADLFRLYGFDVIGIEKMRKRGCKKGLYESVVFAKYSG